MLLCWLLLFTGAIAATGSNLSGESRSPSRLDLRRISKSGPKISRDGRCGRINDRVCTGSVFGCCCSELGYCGSSGAYCKAKCQSSYGECFKEPSSKLSPNGKCGGLSAYTCKGARWGSCCSEHGYCGSSKAYYGNGCRSQF
ncbi:uncharacterized protein BDZ99DRAFT_384695 [Mytilinidion resinicola]|uniref:Chitin-binding type-1 domain-containing protein n=1 Tax=Mytilinidion resinicola TaxID=574789 RepID=A0A6A6YRC1_9PEZI|nr:uncharacterized protein BDZ99DRAFT_384695 [Mytilinidion resinicola]KAF2811476.1 hypothetical protein BDZ99DRAFT_384695 [Mytilinidion resinicola]